MKISLISDDRQVPYIIQALDAALRRFDHEIIPVDDDTADVKLALRHNGLALVYNDQSESILPHPVKFGVLLDKLAGVEARILPERIRIGNHVFHPATSEFMPEGTKDAVRLTEKERDMLLYLYNRKGKDVSRAELLTAVWGYVDGIETHTLETHIYRLRQKIEADPENAHLLVKNENGYCLVDQGDS